MSGVQWVLLGSYLIALAVKRTGSELESLALACIGAWWVYAGCARLFPNWYYRRPYPRSSVAGKSYKAEADQDGFDVAGDTLSWRVRWSGVNFGAKIRAFSFSPRAE
jgi:hypothetical protein